jgi:hypothetical protein
MRDQKDLLLLLPMIAAMFFLVDYSILFSNAYAERQSQTTNTICYGSDNSCYTTFCSNDQPCQTLSSDQPDEEVAVMQPDEEVAVMQPVEVTEKYVDATLEDCEDGVDNDVDGKVDVTDEECSPVQGQKTSLLDNYGRSGQDDSENESSEQKDDSEDNN